MHRTYVLTVLDGWGLGPANQGNPIHAAAPKTIADIEARFPGCALQASGLAVGLPWDEEGNSEVGHVTLGAGRSIPQHSERISRAIADGSFQKNPAFEKAFRHAEKTNGAVHLVGLLTSGIVHASFEHLRALVTLAGAHPRVPVGLHLMTDGIDSAPREARALLTKLATVVTAFPNVTITNVIGRHYGMDRDKHFDRTRKAYRALVGDARSASTWDEALNRAYEKGLNDEFVEPAAIGTPRPIKSGDAVIFFNFREDSMRQLVRAFLDPSFAEFPRVPLENLEIITMTSYEEGFAAAVAFPIEPIKNSFGKIIADRGLRQLRIAETEKYAHVTYFFNGRHDAPFPGEFRVLIPSLAPPHKEEASGMQAHAITDRAILALRENTFDFILINYANPDIIAHTGNYDATVAAVRAVDEELGRLVAAAEEGNHALLITSDHGNAEEVMDPVTGEPETKHNPSPVPCYLVAAEFERANPPRPRAAEVQGFLADVAPTLLELMGIPKPSVMTGASLLPYLRDS